MQERFIVDGLGGEKRLRGEIAVRGAKNAALKALPAQVLFEDTPQYENLPKIEDVHRMQELLNAAGATTKKWDPVLDTAIAERFRASIVLTGPMLARTGEVSFPFPGGCVLGERAIDLFLHGFKAMGAEVEEKNSYFTLRAGKKGKLKGADITFPLVSVTGTETLMMAAVLAEGETVLQNAAMEPEIPALADYLNACGAKIQGAGTPTIKIVGGDLLQANGTIYHTPPDRIETGSFMLLAAIAGREVAITECEPAHVGVLTTLLQNAGVSVEVGSDRIIVRGGNTQNSNYKMISVRTHEYPGFPTDLQAPMAVFMSQCRGEGSILETIFDGRFRYVDDLVTMGADITVMNPHRILIRGPKHLTRKELESPDLRGGLAYILAASVASGESIINNAYVIDRGYERIEERLQRIGLNIRRETA